MGGSCGGNTIGNTGINRPSVMPPSALSGALRTYYDAARLVYTLPRPNIARNDAVEIGFDFITSDDAHIELTSDATVALEILFVNADGKNISKDQQASYLEITPSRAPYSQR